jgi:hypothetical protein
VRAPIVALGVRDLVRALTHERQVVQRRCQVRVLRTERRFLNGRGLAQQLFRAGQVAPCHGFLGGIDH